MRTLALVFAFHYPWALVCGAPSPDAREVASPPEVSVCIEVNDSLGNQSSGVLVVVNGPTGIELSAATAANGQSPWFPALPGVDLTCALFPTPLADGSLLGCSFRFEVPTPSEGYTLQAIQGFSMPRAQRVHVRGGPESLTYDTQQQDYPFWSLVTPRGSNASFECQVAPLVGPASIAATARFHGFEGLIAPYRRGAVILAPTTALGAGQGAGLAVFIDLLERIEESGPALLEPTIDVIRCVKPAPPGAPLVQPQLQVLPFAPSPFDAGIALIGSLQAGSHFVLVREKNGVPGRLIDVFDQAPAGVAQQAGAQTPPPAAGSGCEQAVDCDPPMPIQPQEPAGGPCPAGAGPTPHAGCPLSGPVLVGSSLVAGPITERKCGNNGGVCKMEKIKQHTFSVSLGKQSGWAQGKYEFTTSSSSTDEMPYAGTLAGSCGLCLRWYGGGYTYRYRWDKRFPRSSWEILWPEGPFELPGLVRHVDPCGNVKVVNEDASCGEFKTVGICNRFPRE